LHKPRICTGLDTVVERLECHAPLGKLSFEIFVTVDAELGRVGKVGTELQEERAEVLIDAIKVVDPMQARRTESATVSVSSHHQHRRY